MQQSYTKSTSSSVCSKNHGYAEAPFNVNNSFVRVAGRKSTLPKGTRLVRKFTPGISYSKNCFDSTEETSQPGVEKLKKCFVAASTSKKIASNSCTTSRPRSSLSNKLGPTSSSRSSSSSLSEVASISASIQQSSPSEVALTSPPKEGIYPSIFLINGPKNGNSQKVDECIRRGKKNITIRVDKSEKAMSMEKLLKKRVDENNSEVIFGSYGFGVKDLVLTDLSNNFGWFLEKHRSKNYRAPVCIVISGRSRYNADMQFCEYGYFERGYEKTDRVLQQFQHHLQNAAVTIILAVPDGWTAEEAHLGGHTGGSSRCFGYRHPKGLEGNDSDETIQTWVKETIANNWKTMCITV